jgi:hypothetical protein
VQSVGLSAIVLACRDMETCGGSMHQGPFPSGTTAGKAKRLVDTDEGFPFKSPTANVISAPGTDGDWAPV